MRCGDYVSFRRDGSALLRERRLNIMLRDYVDRFTNKEERIVIELPIHGRGASGNLPNRFEPIAYEPMEDEGPEEEVPGPRTSFYKDFSRSLITTNDSPDISFDASINPYRGCEHGCIYCCNTPRRVHA